MGIRTVSQVQRAYDHLLERILDGTLEPGARIDVDAVATTLGISRQPIRDAVNRLAAEWFVQVIPQVGCVVSLWSERETADTLQMGILVLAEICALAASRRSAHDLQALRSIQSQIDLFRSSGASGSPGYLRSFRALDASFHAAISAAIDSPALEMLALSFYNRCEFAVLSRRLARATDSAGAASPGGESPADLLALESESHRAMLDAIERGDTRAAWQAAVAYGDRLVGVASGAAPGEVAERTR